jgi:uncharacterized repeat protein (TIGR03803 family)
LTTLVSFNGSNGAGPVAGLIADAAGDLFGTTYLGGANGDGTVFEIAKTGSGYASTPTTLFSFNGTNGTNPVSSLIADAAGDLFGTTLYGGANNGGTVFELSDTGFRVTIPVTIDLGNGNYTVTAGTSSTITLGNGNDSVTAGANSTISVGNGNDTMNAGANSTITLGNGNDKVYAGASDLITLGNGNDTVYAGTSDTITLGKGNDTIAFGVPPQPGYDRQ